MAGSQTDPLPKLGSDVFHMILSYLNLRDLAAVERVAPTWRRFSQWQTHLWRRVCERENIDVDEYKHWKEAADASEAEGTENRWRDAALSNLNLPAHWRRGHCFPRTLRNPGQYVLALYDGPESHLITAKVWNEDTYQEEGLRVMNKNTGEVLYTVDGLAKDTNVITGGGYIVTSPHGMNVVSLMPLGRVSIFRTPAVRARLGDPPLMTEPNADGSRPLEKCAALDWMAECERMAIRIDTVRGKPSPVLIAARASEVYVCHLDQGMRRYRILIAGFSLVTFGDILAIQADDKYIYLLEHGSVYIVSRITRSPLIRLMRHEAEYTNHLAAIAFKFPTQTVLNLWTALPNREPANPDGTAHVSKVKLRRVMEWGREESIWAEESPPYAYDEQSHHSDWADCQCLLCQDDDIDADDLALYDDPTHDHSPGLLDEPDQEDQQQEHIADNPGLNETDEGVDPEGVDLANAPTSDWDDPGDPSDWSYEEAWTPDSMEGQILDPADLVNDILNGVDDAPDPDWEDDPEPEDADFLQGSSDPAECRTGSRRESSPDNPPGLAPFNWFDFEDLTGADDRAMWHGLCFTNNDMVLHGAASGLLILRNYRQVLKEAASFGDASSYMTELFVASHTMIIASPWGDNHGMDVDVQYGVTTSGDFIICHHSNMGGVAILDSTQFPSLPLPESLESRVEELDATIVTMPYGYVSGEYKAPPLVSDSRSIYFSDHLQAFHRFPQRKGVLREKWNQMMKPYPNGIRVWEFRE